MTEKIVYQTDSMGVYVGTVIADESPLEADVYLIPAGCVEETPPLLLEGQRARWNNTNWVVETKVAIVETKVTPVEEVEEVATAEQVFKEAIQLHLDNTAQSFGYDNIQSAVTYADEPASQKFQLEGLGFRAWRSLVWAYVYEQAAEVAEGLREQPPLVEFLSELPELVIPEAAS